MRIVKLAFLIFIILINSLFLAGCWNYKEIDKMAIVAGVAVDKGSNKEYLMTAEIIKISGGRDAKMSSEFLSSEGDSLFDAIRNIISLSGKKLYWGHAQVLIISKDIASEGMHKVLDWYKRDAETREDTKILIAKTDKAKQIFEGKGTTENIVSIVLAKILDNEANLAKAPKLDISRYDLQFHAKGASAVLPTINVRKEEDKLIPEIAGVAIIKDDKLTGFLEGEETKYLLFIQDEIKGGLLVQNIRSNKGLTKITLEIFGNKTKIKPEVKGQTITMNIITDTVVAIDEVEGKENVIDEVGLKTLTKISEEALKRRIEDLIKKVQSEYNADIFGFGMHLHSDKPKEWKKVEKDWNKIFKDIKINVKTKIDVKNSGVINKPLEESE